jgi:hypothetical protein
MAMFPSELSSPAAIYLAHESCPLNGVLLVSGGGQVMRMAIMENEGYRTDKMTVENIAANIGQIIDMKDCAHIGIGGNSSMPVVKK